jgi:hypothetical protein
MVDFHKKTAQRKQSPNRRKFAQSGHPGSDAKLLKTIFVVCPLVKRKKNF